jgi:hypothetical protein
MSIESYTKAKKLMLENPKTLHFSGQKDEALIDKAEKVLNLKFPQDYRKFLLDFGTLDFAGEEIYGITNDNFYHSCIPNAIWYNINMRRIINIPEYLFVIHSIDDGSEIALNYKILNENGEPKMTSYEAGYDVKEQEFEVIANDFGDFLLDIVVNGLKEML